MPLIPIEIPAGVRSIGTDLQSTGRWLDSNLVRWVGGSLRPVGGWRERVAGAFDYAPRGMVAWEDNSAGRHIVGGDYQALKHINASGTVTDITPVGLAGGMVDADVNTGYGGYFYGLSYYGTPRPDSGTYSEATTWALDTWGEYLVANNPSDGNIYEWQLDTGTPAEAILNAPTCSSIVVTEERFLFALGADGNQSRVAWCDQEDNTDWTTTTTNQAGDYELQASGRIMCGVRTSGQTLIITDSDAHSARYIGPPFVYGFERVGTSCGIASRKAAASTDVGVFWIGINGFHFFNGSSVSDLPCDVYDAVFSDMSASQITKTWAWVNGENGEVWWFYVSSGSNEIDKYVTYNYREGHWSLGSLSRTAGAPRGTFRTPILCDSAGDMFDHEVGTNHDGAQAFAETAPISIGDNFATFTNLIPDEGTQGQLSVTFKTRPYPNGAEASHGPYNPSNPTSVRFSGRQFRMRVDGVAGEDWRSGIMRLKAQIRGQR